MPDMLRRAAVLGGLAALASSALPSLAAALGAFSSDRITVTVEGEGDDVILMSGVGSSPRIWRDLIRAVPNHRYHLVQISGFAGQPARGNASGLVGAPAAEEVARYIATARLSRPAVIGHSLGGLIGLMLASRHPDSLSRLMVVDVRPFTGEAFGPARHDAGEHRAGRRRLRGAVYGPRRRGLAPAGAGHDQRHDRHGREARWSPAGLGDERT